MKQHFPETQKEVFNVSIEEYMYLKLNKRNALSETIKEEWEFS